MNKAKCLIGAVGMLAVLILTGCDFLKNSDYADSIPLPPALPVATPELRGPACSRNAHHRNLYEQP